MTDTTRSIPFANLAPGPLGIDRMGLQQAVQLASRHGFGGTDLPAEALESEERADHARELAQQHHLHWGLFNRPGDFFGDEHAYEQGMYLLRRIAPLAARAGCTRTYDHIWPGSNERRYKENLQFHSDRLKPVARILAEHGITFGIEFIGPETLRARYRHLFIHRLDQAIELQQAVGEGTGIVVDMFHLYTSGGQVSDLSQLRGLPIVNVHANDARADRTRQEQIDGERAMPMTTGAIDAPAMLAKLMEMGYAGPVIAEPFEPTKSHLRSLGPDAAAAEASRALARLLDHAEIALIQPHTSA